MSRDRTVGDTFYVAFTTRAFATGIPTTLSGTPVISAYEDGGLTQITAGLTLGADHDSVTGLNMITVVATGGNGFETSKDYNLVITTGTVGGVSVVGEVVGQFSLGLSAAAVDLANGTDGLGAIKAETAAILLDTAEIGAAGAGLTALATQASVDTVDSNVDAILLDTAEIGAAGAGLTALATQASVDTVDSNVDAILVDTSTTLDTKLNDIQGATFSTSTDSLEAIRDRGDAAWTGGGGLTLADIADAVWDESLAAHQTALSAGRAATLGGVPIAETTATGTPTTTTIELTAGSTIDNYYRDATLRILSGSGIGQARIITSYTGATKTCTFDEALITAPVATDAVAVDMSHAHAVSSIADAVLDEALSGHTTAGTLGKAITDTETDAAAILVDTAQIGTAGAGLTDLGGMSTAMKAEVNAEADTAISDYDPPTNAEMVARTLVAASYFDPAADTVATVTDVTNQVSANVTAISGDSTAADSLEASLETLVTGTATGTPTTTTMADSALTEVTDDHYNGRVIIWRTGALKHQATDITSYDGTTKTFTFTATTNAASAGDAYVIV